MRKMQGEVNEVQNFDGSTQTIKEYLTAWLASAKVSIRYTTWKQYLGFSNRFLLPEIGEIRLFELRADHEQHLFDRLISKDVGHYSIIKAHQMFMSALTHALKLDLINRNPASMIFLPKKPANEMRIFDENQVNQLLFAAYGHRLEALFHLAVVNGMREMELLGLKWVDLDWVKHNLKVERQLLRPQGEGIQFSSPKTRYGKRSIKLGPKTIESLRKHFELQQQDRIKAAANWQESDPRLQEAFKRCWVTIHSVSRPEAYRSIHHAES